MTRPRTAQDIAHALRLVAGQIADVPTVDPIGGEHGPYVTVNLGVATTTEVDQLAHALFGRNAETFRMGDGTWHHTTAGMAHDTRINVIVWCTVPDPTLVRLRAERDDLLRQLADCGQVCADQAQDPTAAVTAQKG